MNAPEKKINWLQLLILALPFLVIAAFWSKFPPRVPSHWNLYGQADGWMNKAPGLLLLPLANIGICALFTFLPRLDPRLRPPSGRMPDALRTWRLAFTTYVGYMSLLDIAIALGIHLDMDRMIMNGLLILFLFVGNFLGTLRPNKYAGIRTPWTLKDPEIWRATHRLSARVLFYGCLVLLVAQWLLTGVQLLLVSLALLFAWSLWIMAYSYILFRAKQRAAP